MSIDGTLLFTSSSASVAARELARVLRCPCVYTTSQTHITRRVLNAPTVDILPQVPSPGLDGGRLMSFSCGNT